MQEALALWSQSIILSRQVEQNGGEQGAKRATCTLQSDSLQYLVFCTFSSFATNFANLSPQHAAVAILVPLH